MKTEFIPKFYLYGDIEDNFNDEVIHIESISDRSKKECWEIRPHIHKNLCQIIIIINGNVSALLDNERFNTRSESVIIIPSGVIHSFVFFPDTQGYVLTIDEKLANRLSDSKAKQYLTFVTKRQSVLSFKSDSQYFLPLRTYFKHLYNEFNTRHTTKCFSMEWMTKLILMTIYREMENEYNIQNIQVVDNTFDEFSNLIESHYQSQWPVSKYSEVLGVSISTLNRLCRREKGNTAKQLINERLLIEAIRYLTYSQYRIEQIAYKLGFEDPAYFSRFFKLKSGISPKNYRGIHSNNEKAIT
ncbi:MAG: HTH-type transcriptional activator RhaR [Candidatus Celerinatantimonas neptuna]|nr:MAG: HTH-type transcriptional activator RhaR [Candidatus Celerinatantimonas neptuna]